MVGEDLILDAVEAVRKITAQTSKPWLLVGKGPSFNNINKLDLSRYNVFTLNHTCRHVPATIAHFYDIEAFDDCVADLTHKPVLFCMPYYPNAACTPSKLSLVARALMTGKERPLLREAIFTGRMLSYNTDAKGRSPLKGVHQLRARLFSAVVAFNLLAAAGEKFICTIGIDGGKDYATPFDQKDRLVNGQSSFDVQFAEIEKTCEKYKVLRKPLFQA